MNFVDYDNLSPRQLINQYIIETRNKGHFLSYTDYAIVEEWVKASRSVDDLLIVLDSIIPGYMEKHKDRSVPPSLKGVRELVLKKLDDYRNRDSSLRSE